jgi:hypothetical protein
MSMRLCSAAWLATLRARKRALLYALVPAFALAAVSGPACAAMAAAPDPAAATHDHGGHAQPGDAHEHAPEQPLSVPCPHCPLEAGGANVGHTVCTTAAGHDDVAAPAKAASQESPPALTRNWALPAAVAVPPLIATPAAAEEPPQPKVPLNLLHCVLVI